jgi:hypothetical protein
VRRCGPRAGNVSRPGRSCRETIEMRHRVGGDACKDDRGTRDRRHAQPDRERHGAARRAVPAPARLRPRAVPELAQRLNWAGCLEGVLHCCRVLSPEVVGAGRQRGLWLDRGVGSNPARRGRIGGCPERHQLLSGTDPVARKLQHVALSPSFVPVLLSLPPFRFHEVCRPFVVGRADNILGRR